ncbi:hypothetical protein ODZ84_17130 [Chryseobacterium fluminis]|uniref:bacteriocin-like protein n=1 Tax=Chryseobacterium fluminis TaxID=2983606 RepID=UPI0022525DE8|nr:hypothetical protein [Chryseobacterium sp. MMS21-Ot14]UZT96925.1 hypothetical protein ODZ84_17130 [Chryseobacterium sp. MMS21-Ot14]
MNNLKKLSRGSLKTVKGGITEECARAQAAATACYSTITACQDNAPSDFGDLCRHLCNRYCY